MTIVWDIDDDDFDDKDDYILDKGYGRKDEWAELEQNPDAKIG